MAMEETGPILVAELSANHGQEYNRAVETLHAAKEAGAHAVKLQTYTADTMTLDCDAPPFRVGGGTIWDGRNLYGLYQEAHTPWEWQPRLMAAAQDLGLTLFSTPFDPSAVDFLEEMDVPLYKIASFELVDIPLLERIGATRKPVVASTGMATLAEIDEAVHTLRQAGCPDLMLLKCVSSYPAPAEEFNLSTLPHLASSFDTPVGLSDHTLGSAVAVAATALGARMIEKHFILSRDLGGPDAPFSTEPDEFRSMATDVLTAAQALGTVTYQATPAQQACKTYRRSLFATRNIRAGEALTAENIRCLRPAHGLHPRYLPQVLRMRAVADIERGTPLSWNHLCGMEND